MAKVVELPAEPRQEIGRSAVRKLRNAGRLPGVIYGRGIDAQKLTVDRHELVRTLHAHGAHPLVTLNLEGQGYLAIVKEVQMDPVRLEALHVDFHRVEEDKPVQSEVNLELTGNPIGVREGGVLEIQLRTLLIEALPRALPELLQHDVTDLQMGDVVRVSDLSTPEGVTVLNDADDTVASVAAPRLEEPEVTEEPLEPGEVPEVGEEEAEEAGEGTEEGGGEG